jgi:hypothetical protein
MPQTETDLWQELNDAVAAPQLANLKRLCELLDWAIAHLPEAQQLEAAGRAIEQMAEIYALRFNLLIGSWEETDSFLGEALPVLDLETLEAWIRQSMSVDLDVLVEQPKSKRNQSKQTHNPTDSVVAVVEPEAILQMVEQIEQEEQSQMIRRLAGEEDPARWSAAISRWIQHHSPSQPIHLGKLQYSLGMPLVEIWMGLLLSNEFRLEATGDFYYGEVWIRYEPGVNALL